MPNKRNDTAYPYRPLKGVTPPPPPPDLTPVNAQLINTEMALGQCNANTNTNVKKPPPALKSQRDYNISAASAFCFGG